MNKKLLELMVRSLDETLSVDEQNILSKALSEAKELREEIVVMKRVRRVKSDSAAPAFKPYFARQIMNRIHAEAVEEDSREVFFESLYSLFRPMAIGAAMMLIAVLSFSVLKHKKLPFAGLFSEPEVTVELAFDPTYTYFQE